MCGWGSTKYVGWGSKQVETGLEGFENGCWDSKWNARELRRVSGGSKMRVGRYKRVVVGVNRSKTGAGGCRRVVVGPNWVVVGVNRW